MYMYMCVCVYIYIYKYIYIYIYCFGIHSFNSFILLIKSISLSVHFYVFLSVRFTNFRSEKKTSRKKEVMITIGNAFFHLATNEVYQAAKIYRRSLKKKYLISIKSS